VPSPSSVLAIVRRHALALPAATERISHGSPAFFVGKAPQFATFVDHRHGTDGLGIWCAAPIGVQAELVETEPERFYVPKYVGGRGWIGLHLDAVLDEPELAAVLRDAYLTVAPARLRARLDGDDDPARPA
jgi:hypothetical protein